jgi:hypothetical protein
MFFRNTVDLQQTRQHYVPEIGTLHNRRSEKLNSAESAHSNRWFNTKIVIRDRSVGMAIVLYDDSVDLFLWNDTKAESVKSSKPNCWFCFYLPPQELKTIAALRLIPLLLMP